MEKATRQLLFSNVPATCREDYLRQWIQARGYFVTGMKLIRDTVTGTSPCFAYVQLAEATKIDEAARTLNGQPIHQRRVRVTPVTPRRSKAVA